MINSYLNLRNTVCGSRKPVANGCKRCEGNGQRETSIEKPVVLQFL